MKTNHYSKLRQQILTSMIVVPLIPFLLALIIGYIYFTSTLENTTIASLNRIVEDHRQMIDTFLQERRANLEFVIHTQSFDNLSQPWQLQDTFHHLQLISRAFVDLGVFNEEGLHVAYQGPWQLTGKIYRDELWFREVMKKGVHISDVFLGFREVPHFIIAVSRQENGRIWVLRATIDTYIFDNLVKKVRIGRTGEAYLINYQGLFQTEPRSGGRLLDADPESALYLKKHDEIETFISNDARHGLFTTLLPSQEAGFFLYATTWLKEVPWMLVVRQEKDDAFRNLRTAMYLIILVTVIGLSAIILLGFYQTRRIIQKMEQMDAEKGGLENQLIRATRLAELGQMATGFAHEINNPLQIMRSEQALMDFILKEIKEKNEITNLEALQELEDSINQIVVQIDRCSHITHAILKFGRKSDPVLENVHLQDYLPEIVKMISNKASVNGINLITDIEPGTPQVFGDKGQLQQVMLNLLNNAMDAVLDRHGVHGGELAIRTRGTDNQQVEIAVQDNGSGISPENLKKIFSPFFTTKPVGKGTGLGLAVCFGIIDSLGGVMEVQSQVNEGTTFFIRLPAVTPSPTT